MCTIVGVSAVPIVSPDSMIKVSDPAKHPGKLNDDDVVTKHTHTQTHMHKKEIRIQIG